METCHHSIDINADYCIQKVNSKFLGIQTTSLFQKFSFLIKKHKIIFNCL